MKYVETRDFEKVDEVKRDVLALYRNDIRKYADNQATKVAAIFEEIPGQLQKHEKKFVLSALHSEARMRVSCFLVSLTDNAEITKPSESSKKRLTKK